METIGLLGLFSLCALDDLKTKTVRVIEIVLFGVLGVLIHGVNGKTDKLSILGGMLIGVFFYIFAIATKEKIGKGDALIIMVAGLYLGFAKTMELIWISSVLAGVVGLYLLLIKKEKKSFEIPFVPFLLAGYVLMYAGNSLIGVMA